MAHIFISYAKKDTRSLAEKLYDELNSIPGLTAWMDMSLEADDSWAMQIQREINACDYMVVLLSPDVNRPETDTQAYSFVLKEIAFAQMRKIRILPVMVQQTDMPLTIADVQYIDITRTPNDPTKIVERVCRRFNLPTLAELRQKEAAEQARREREAEEKRRKELLQQQQEEEQRQEQRRREEAARLAELQRRRASQPKAADAPKKQGTKSVYISYSKRDAKSPAQKLYEALNAIPGLTAWMDQSLTPDANWALQIQNQIEAADYVVVLLSPDVNRPITEAQDTSFVRQEIYFVDQLNKPILPVLVGPTRIPIPLARLRYIDLTKNPSDVSAVVEEISRHFNLLAPQSVQRAAEIERDSTAHTPPKPMPAVKPQYDYSSPPQQKDVGSFTPYDYDPYVIRGEDETRPLWRWAVVFVVLVVLVGGGGFAVLSLTNRDSQSPTPTVGVVEDTGDESDATAQPISEATDTATPTDTPTSTHTPGGPTATATSTRTPTSTPTSTYTPEPNHVTPQVSSNAEWTPVEETIAGIPMVLVPAGCFIMGRDDYAEDEKPAHEQCVDEFWIGKYEVTNAQFAEFINAGGYDNPEYWTEAGWEIRQDESWTAPRYWDDPNFNNANQPVVGVSWYEALAYATWRGATLPTEAQWEYAARGPDSLLYPWGNEYDGAVFIHNGSTDGTTAEVGSKPEGASWVGALDLSGNVGEWTLSRFASYPYVANDGREVIPGRSSREMRGSTWYSRTVERAQSAGRNAVSGNLRNDVYGFRVASPAN